jgi:hypothetical protein
LIVEAKIMSAHDLRIDGKVEGTIGRQSRADPGRRRGGEGSPTA